MNGLRLFTMLVLIYHLLNKKASLFTHELITNVYLKLSVLHFGNLKSHFRLPFVFPFFLNMLLIASILPPPLSPLRRPSQNQEASIKPFLCCSLQKNTTLRANCTWSVNGGLWETQRCDRRRRNSSREQVGCPANLRWNMSDISNVIRGKNSTPR